MARIVPKPEIHADRWALAGFTEARHATFEQLDGDTPLRCQPPQRRGVEEANMGGILLVAPRLKARCFGPALSHHPEPTSWAKAAPKPIELEAWLSEVLENFGGGDEIVSPREHFCVGLVEL